MIMAENVMFLHECAFTFMRVICTDGSGQGVGNVSFQFKIKKNVFLFVGMLDA